MLEVNSLKTEMFNSPSFGNIHNIFSSSENIQPIDNQIDKENELVPPKKAFQVNSLMSPRYIAHLFGDSFIEGTSLSGWFLEDALLHMVMLLKDNQGRFNLKHLIERFEKCLEIQGEILQVYLKSELEAKKKIEIKSLAKQLVDITSNLKPNEPFIFPGGCEGHGILFEVILQDDAQFSFNIYNTGAGNDHHWILPRDFMDKIKIQVEYKINDIPPDNILQQRYFEDILKLHYLDDEEFAETLYEEILPDLNGNRVPMSSDYDQFMTPQRAGTCAWKVLCAYLKYNMPVEEYKLLIFLGRFQVFEKLKKINHPFDFQSTIKELVKKMVLEQDFKFDYTKNELLALSLMKMEKYLKKYSCLLDKEEVENKIKPTLAYFTQSSDANSWLQKGAIAV